MSHRPPLPPPARCFRPPVEYSPVRVGWMRFLKGIGVFLLLVAVSKSQQDMGVITGLVTDPSRAAVAGATVSAVNRETNEIRFAATSETGVYTVGPLRIGVYDISIEKAGFKKAIRGEVALHAQDRAPTLDDPNTNLESPDFGKVRRTVSAPRQIQFALRIQF